MCICLNLSLTFVRSYVWRERVLALSQMPAWYPPPGQGSKNLALVPSSCTPAPMRSQTWVNQVRVALPTRCVTSFHILQRLSNDRDSVMILGSSAACEGPCMWWVSYVLLCPGATAAGCGCPCGVAGTWMVAISVGSMAVLSTFPSVGKIVLLGSACSLCSRFLGSIPSLWGRFWSNLILSLNAVLNKLGKTSTRMWYLYHVEGIWTLQKLLW